MNSKRLENFFIIQMPLFFLLTIVISQEILHHIYNSSMKWFIDCSQVFQRLLMFQTMNIYEIDIIFFIHNGIALFIEEHFSVVV